MFNNQHIWYMVISFTITAILLVLCGIFIKKDKNKNLILLLSAVITVAIHYSDLWYGYFANNGEETISGTHILPMYPCNVVMWMLLAASLIKNKKSIGFKLLADFCFYAGVICGVVGIMFNINFDNTPTLKDYYVLKGLLSHSTMLFGCIYIMVGRFIKIRVSNIIGITAGLGVFVLCGLLVNGLFALFGMESPDGMFLYSNPLFPVSPMLLGPFAILLLAGILALVELRLPKEERWYSLLKKKFAKSK